MREYAKLSPTFWTGETGRAIRSHGPEALIVAMYLVSSPMSNMLGIYHQPLLYMAHETGLGVPGATKGLQACEAEGFCRFDPKTETVWVVEMASWQIAKQLKATDNRCLGIQREYLALPRNPFLLDFFNHYQTKFHLTESRGLDQPSATLPSHEHEREHEKKEHSRQKPHKDLLGDTTNPPVNPKERLSQVADDAIRTFNASSLVKTNGGRLATVNANVGRDKRRAQVGRCIRVARDICREKLSTGGIIVTEFWSDYWDAVAEDDFMAGRQQPKGDHSNWRPDFEYLTREATMLKVFERISETT